MLVALATLSVAISDHDYYRNLGIGYSEFSS